MQQDSIHIVRAVPRDTVPAQHGTTVRQKPQQKELPVSKTVQPVSPAAPEVRDSMLTDTLTAVPDTIVYQPQPLPETEEKQDSTTSALWGWENMLTRMQKSKLQKIDYLNDSVPRFEFTAELAPLRGIPGDELPYRFKEDSFVTIILILSFFLMTWVFTRSRQYLSAQATEYFSNRSHHDSSADSLHHELNGKVLMIFQTCFIVGLVFFDLTQDIQKEVFLQVDPFKILACTTGICFAYYLLKIIMYRFVNSIFFDRQQCSTWNETYLLHILLTGLIMLPLVLLIVYFDLTFMRLLTLFIGVIAVAKALLLYKCHRIFFNYTLGWVHLFLYFCTLEIVPLLILVRVMVYANNFLLTTN